MYPRSCLGEMDAVMTTHKQHNPDAFLQQTYLLADRSWGHAQAFGRRLEAA
ncbi:hypothetical protein D3C77_396130 [compost metagenome]